MPTSYTANLTAWRLLELTVFRLVNAEQFLSIECVATTTTTREACAGTFMALVKQEDDTTLA